MGFRSRIGRRVVAGMMLFGASVAGAQNVGTEVPDTTSSGGQFFIRTGYGHRFETQLKDARGEFSTDDGRLEIGGTADFGRVRWANAFAYSLGHYDSDALDANVHGFTLASIVGIGVAKSCSILVGPVVGMSAEEDADWGDAWSVGALLGTTYRVSDDLTLGLSVVALRRIEEGVGITPIPTIDWHFADDFQLYVGLTEVAARRGVGSFLAWNFAPAWELAVGSQFEHRRFRVDAGDGIVEDKSVPVYARLSVQVVTDLHVDLTAGAIVGGELEANDRNDDFLGDVDYDSAPLLGLRVRYALAGL